MGARPITFLSDYGYDDEFAGLCRAVIAGIAPDVRIIDLTHGIRRHAVTEGAAVLANALPYTPAGVHLAVVDPGVGSTRRAVALRVADDDRVLVGPDNGLLWPAAQKLGGVVEAIDLELSPFRLEPVSATFHGRDLFAPVAARLAAGAAFAEAGEAIDPATLTLAARERAADRQRAGRGPRGLRRPLRQRGARPRPRAGSPRQGCALAAASGSPPAGSPSTRSTASPSAMWLPAS